MAKKQTAKTRTKRTEPMPSFGRGVVNRLAMGGETAIVSDMEGRPWFLDATSGTIRPLRMLPALS